MTDYQYSVITQQNRVITNQLEQIVQMLIYIFWLGAFSVITYFWNK